RSSGLFVRRERDRKSLIQGCYGDSIGRPPAVPEEVAGRTTYVIASGQPGSWRSHLDRERGQERESKARKGDDSFADGPGLHGFGDAEVEVLLYQPESTIVHMREDERACAGGDGEEFGRGARGLERYGRDNTRGCSHCNGSGACGKAHKGGKQPAEDQQRQVVLQRDLDHSVRNPAVLKHATKAAAGADEERDGCSGGEALIGESEDGIAGDAAHDPEGDEAYENPDEEGNIVVAKKADGLICKGAARGKGVGPAAHEHQDDGKKDAANGEPKPGERTTWSVIFEIVGHWILGGDLDPGSDDFRKDRTGEGSGRDSDEESVEDCAANVGVVSIHGQKRSGVRRDETMIDGERRDQRKCNANEGSSRASCDGVGDGNKENKTDLEEGREAHDDADDHHGPWKSLFTEDADEGERDRVCSA